MFFCILSQLTLICANVSPNLRRSHHDEARRSMKPWFDALFESLPYLVCFFILQLSSVKVFEASISCIALNALSERG